MPISKNRSGSANQTARKDYRLSVPYVRAYRLSELHVQNAFTVSKHGKKAINGK
jgi:hypothetical protein